MVVIKWIFVTHLTGITGTDIDVGLVFLFLDPFGSDFIVISSVACSSVCLSGYPLTWISLERLHPGLSNSYSVSCD